MRRIRKVSEAANIKPVLFVVTGNYNFGVSHQRLLKRPGAQKAEAKVKVEIRNVRGSRLTELRITALRDA